MDNYIYFRVLEHLSKYGVSTQSDLVNYGGVKWTNNPVKFLYEKGFLEIGKGSYKGAVYYQLTDQGRELHHDMKIFYDLYHDALVIVNKKLKRRRKL